MDTTVAAAMNITQKRQVELLELCNTALAISDSFSEFYHTISLMPCSHWERLYIVHAMWAMKFEMEMSIDRVCLN